MSKSCYPNRYKATHITLEQFRLICKYSSNTKPKGTRRKLFNRNDCEAPPIDIESKSKPLLPKKANQDNQVQLKVPIPDFFGRFKTEQTEAEKTPTSARKHRLGELVVKTPTPATDPVNRGCVTGNQNSHFFYICTFVNH